MTDVGDESKSSYGTYRRTILGLSQASLGLPPASRKKDPETAKDAGRIFEDRGLGSLHRQVLAALDDGPLTDEDLERRPEFAHLAPSTVRKRRSELLDVGMIRCVDTVKNSRGRAMMRWAKA